MKVNWKTVLKKILLVLPIVLIFGTGTFLLYLFGNFGMFPLYVTRVVPIVGIALALALCVICAVTLNRKQKRVLWGVFSCVLLCCAVYVGFGAYEDSIPTVDDRQLLLWEYQPFQKENKLVTLNAESTLKFDNPWAVRVDGATALYPIYAAFAQAVYPEGEYPHYQGSVQCGGTIDAYERLVKGETDVIFVAAPSAAQQEMAKNTGKEFHYTPIGKEAFVFFVNSKNPVASLTVEQIRGIYSGEIKNWKDVGGKRQSIRPFQRAENSGSQSALQRLMEGLPLLEPEKRDRIAGMGGIITEVASYRNHSNAIGFSFRFYSTEMVKNGDIRLLALNGVEPTRETIRDGSYPIASEFYAVTVSDIGGPAPQESNPKLAAFLDWILSAQGQEIIEKTGYVALQ
ncbi:MAG: hypothetical protein E7429_02105 [Ruminococcaceae bacterium]|nr:hypothetical protein [Oscillospiraceae bacterium]